MSKIINGVASEYEMPREPKFYENVSDPARKVVNTEMLKQNNLLQPVRQPIGNGDRICSTCNKEDVCMYKGELAQVVKEITQISERENVFIDTDIRCKKWFGKDVNIR